MAQQRDNIRQLLLRLLACPRGDMQVSLRG
jgi:hypothetical protein